MKHTVVVHEVVVRAVPHLLGDRAAGIQIHAHALLLRALAGEDVGGDGLLDFGLAEQHLLLRLSVAGLHLDDLAASNHANVLELDVDRIVGQHHTNQRRVEAANASDVVLGGPSLHQAAHGCAGVHAVRDGAGKVRVAGEDTGHVDGVVVSRDLGVGLIRRRSLKLQGGLATQRYWVLEVELLVNRSAVALEIVHDRIAVGQSGGVVNAGNLYNLLGGKLEKDLTTCLHAAENGLVLEPNQALQAEGQGLAQELNALRKVVNDEPLLRLQH
jgi:hypothetical protein